MGNSKFSVEANSISKCYKMYSGSKQKLLDLISPKGAGKEFFALKDISFKVSRGDVVGIIGLNGSGKSTLSNILGGVSLPTKGEIKIEGESSLIAIGIGLNNFLTGMENIEIKCIMMGYEKNQIEKIKQDIIDFADLGDFITQPIRTYSSGMRSRLGFAISVYTDPDILVIDEALSVGDPTFTQKCLDKMNEFKERGKTIFFVSHSTSMVKKFCNKALWLEYGCLREFGDIEKIIPLYDEYIKFINSMNDYEKRAYKNIVLKHQEHALLNEFKIIDPKYKNVKPKGKLIKHALLINKNGDAKAVAYNFDYYTAIFGAIPSLFRKRESDFILILACQIANFFIVPYPLNILTNFIITSVWAVFIGKIYTSHLIEKKGYVDYTVWKISNKNLGLKEAKIKNDEEDLNKKYKTSRLVASLCIGLLIILPISSYYIQNKNLASIAAINQNSIILENKTAIVIINKDGNGKEIVESIGILSQDKSTKSLLLENYKGAIKTKEEDDKTLKDLVKYEELEKIQEVLKKEFSIEITNYLTINIKEYGIITNNNEVVLEELLKAFINSDERGINEKISKIIKGKTSLKSNDLKEFYNKFKGYKDIHIKNIEISK